MPRQTTNYHLQLTEQQLAEARRRASQHSAPYREVLRARLTLVLAEEPHLTHHEAAERCGLKPQTVYKWRRRWANEGWSLSDAERPGRPRRAAAPEAEQPVRPRRAA